MKYIFLLFSMMCVKEICRICSRLEINPILALSAVGMIFFSHGHGTRVLIFGRFLPKKILLEGEQLKYPTPPPTALFAESCLL